MNRDDVAKDLAKGLLYHCYNGTVQSVNEQLLKPIGIESESWIAAREWYAGQPDESKRIVSAIIEHAINLSVFSAAVFLDGDCGMIDVGEGRGEIGVDMRVYYNIDKAMTGIPDEVIPISPSGGGYAVHDYLLDLMDGRLEGDDG